MFLENKMIQRKHSLLKVCIVVLLCSGVVLMAGKSGNKRKKDKNSPSQTVESENKRQMATYSGSFNGSGLNGTSPMQGIPQPGQFTPNIAPATFTYTPNMFGSGTPVHLSQTFPHPTSPGTSNGTSDQGVMNLILQRLDNMDKKLGQLDSIQTSINNITVKVSEIEVKVLGFGVKSQHD